MAKILQPHLHCYNKGHHSLGHEDNSISIKKFGGISEDAINLRFLMFQCSFSLLGPLTNIPRQDE